MTTGQLFLALQAREQAIQRIREIAAAGTTTDAEMAEAENQLRYCEIAYQKAIHTRPLSMGGAA